MNKELWFWVLLCLAGKLSATGNGTGSTGSTGSTGASGVSNGTSNNYTTSIMTDEFVPESRGKSSK